MNITPEQLANHKNSLTLTTAEIELHERELEAWKKRGEAERNLFSWIATMSVIGVPRYDFDVATDPGINSPMWAGQRTPLNAYLTAHENHYAAEYELRQLVIVKLKSTQAILRAMIAEAEQMIKEPGRGIVTQ